MIIDRRRKSYDKVVFSGEWKIGCEMAGIVEYDMRKF